ncbi:hypothetical protein SDC9_75621 [bioreactor metagenome]|uniref:Uncharacterized protein n=1 Tax=bioreactor metagenome TaxID=1076179 RepID=A0A644YKA1_9ZZZZ
MKKNDFQRIGSTSNAKVGSDFELSAKEFFRTEGINLQQNFTLRIGIEEIQKDHAFDLGSEHEKIIVECKSHKWTHPNDNVPSAKMTVWNEAMYYFLLAPIEYRKILFVLKDYSPKRKETLAEYFVRTNKHLIPKGVEIIEYDEAEKIGKRIDGPRFPVEAL